MTLQRIILIDPFSSGHHIEYVKNAIDAAKKSNLSITLICNEEMSRILSSEVDETVVTNLELNSSFISREFSKVQYIKHVTRLIKEQDVYVVHFLYLDHFIYALLFFPIKPRVGYYATLHWFYMLPEFTLGLGSKVKSLLERLCLKNMLFNDWRIMTHSRVGSQKLLGNDNYVLDYPVNPIQVLNTEKTLQFRQNLGLTEESILLLCFGGTRFDKGADFAVKVLSQLDDKYHLVIAGKEEGISFESLTKIAEESNCANHLHLIKGFVSSKDSALLFNACDIVFIPYKKYFSGQSGPLTRGASLGKVIISSDAMILKEIVSRFDLGGVFEAENQTDCKRVINLYKDKHQPRDCRKYTRKHSNISFIGKLSSMYSDANVKETK